MKSSLSSTAMATMWTIGALAFIGWCAFVGWTWVTFYDYSGAARGALVGSALVLGVLLAIWLVICVFAMDEWADVHDP